MAQQQMAELNWVPLVDVDTTSDKIKLLDQAFDSNVVHARAFQQRLVEAYYPAIEEEKLSVPQRFAVILGLTCALWMVVGAVILSTIYTFSRFFS
ncbi:hypothetical protein HNO88_004446 [Novosphingobium chloroacetimidivorans]|uniref:Uncharacterized protein n=1 Tax=Novosphingobium chloroacetimidivorans TaxID=1428314 RepID=A0A7W7KDZ7_9SPHN|nr:hypothetical protein [Novosphingobium chloroacetimidivorans]MBB4861092.1 hypothetical protein [Novosphingobium chloroacetimidivorans]